MELTIENYRGVGAATIKLHDNITIVAGTNGSGKTSVIQALQSAVTGEKMPVSDLKQKDALWLVRDSHKGTNKAARAHLRWNGGQSEVKWPSCKVAGDKFQCSKYAAGIVPATKIPAKELTELLQVLPSKEEFAAEFAAIAEINPPVDKVWEKIQRLGWDETHSQAQERGREMKREWQKLTGQEFGSIQSAKWEPEHYTGQSLEELQQSLSSAEKMYEHTLKVQALSEKERDDLTKLVASIEPLRAEISSKTAELDSLVAELTKAQSMLEMIPDAVNPKQAYECWHCGKLGILMEGTLIEAPDMAVAEADAKAAAAKIAEQKKRIQTLQQKRDELKQHLFHQRNQLDAAKEAERKLNVATIDEAPATVTREDARKEVDLCRAKIEAFHKYEQASEIKHYLTLNQFIIAVASPEGLRKQVLATKLASFNERLAAISHEAGWPLVSLDESLQPRFGDLPYVLISEAQQYAVDATLQVALVQLDKSQIIILDRFDKLDRELRNGLFHILTQLPIPAVVGCKFDACDDVPNLADVGAAFWCEGTAVRALGTQEMAVAH